VSIRVAGPADARALAALRAVWSGGDEPEFAARMAAWLTSEGDRRTTWLVTKADEPVGMASMLEYRRMPRPGRPDSRWGYVSNMFVREELRGRGIGSALLSAVIAMADDRRYARLVLSPSEESIRFYRRAGFRPPDADDRLLVRSANFSH